MIYTVTFNPSLDYIVTVDHFKAGEINRTAGELIYPGGKGINVSIVLKNLGYDNTALGFMAGFTGREIQRLLEEMGVQTDFIHVSNGTSRINLKMRSDQETEINGRGPKISDGDSAAVSSARPPSGGRYSGTVRKHSFQHAGDDLHGYHEVSRRPRHCSGGGRDE